VNGSDWTRNEVDLIVADYFTMLRAEMLEQPYSKNATPGGDQAAPSGPVGRVGWPWRRRGRQQTAPLQSGPPARGGFALCV